MPTINRYSLVRNEEPFDYGYLGWTFDPSSIAGAATPTAGVLYLSRIKLFRECSVSKGVLWNAAAGTTMGATYLALYDAAGNLLTKSADVNNDFDTSAAGLREVSFAATVRVPRGYYFLGYVSASGTQATLSRAGSAASVNGGLAAPFRWSTSGSSLTDAPATVTMGSATAATNALWAALK